MENANASTDRPISVVIRVRNDPERLRLALDSIRRSEIPAEVVIIDNESGDETAAVAAELGDVVRRVEGRVGDLLVVGAACATSPVVCFMDADHQVLPATLGDALAALPPEGAVVLPERSLRAAAWWSRVVSAERAWVEASGLGLPRVFHREHFLGLRQPSAVSFGEDRVIADQVAVRVLGRTPILHDDPPPWRLLRKYARYGFDSASAESEVPKAAGVLSAHVAGFRLLDREHRRWVPAVVVTKAAKMLAFSLGRAAGRLARWRAKTSA